MFLGPEYWGERYRECAGKHQSPININVLRVKQVTLPDLVLVGFDDSIDDVHVTNNGHTGKVSHMKVLRHLYLRTIKCSIVLPNKYGSQQ